ncbi:unnamed protein product, partial [Ectocarpus sp. 12 AP-2014]
APPSCQEFGSIRPRVVVMVSAHTAATGAAGAATRVFADQPQAGHVLRYSRGLLANLRYSNTDVPRLFEAVLVVTMPPNQGPLLLHRLFEAVLVLTMPPNQGPLLLH